MSAKPDDDNLAYKNDVLNFVKLTFGLGDAKIMAAQENVWENWVKLKRRTWRDLVSLLGSDIQNTFKARAICILLVPNKDLNPFAWDSDELSYGNYLSQRDEWDPKNLSATLKMFVCELILLNIKFVHSHTNYERLQESCVTQYNNMILTCLSFLPTENPVAEALFQHHMLNDLNTFCTMDEASGYNPFRSLLMANVPEIWKKRADQCMRGIVLAEQSGQAKPRADWEKAEDCYKSHVQRTLFEKPFPYSAELFALQVEFILQFPNPERKAQFQSYRLPRMFEVLEASTYRDLRHRIAVQAILTAEGQFDVFRAHENDMYIVARRMLTEFPEDTALCERLRVIIREADEEEVRTRANAVAHKRQADAVLAAMR